MWLLENAIGKGGLPLVRLSSTANNAVAVIYLFGATLTSWTNKDGIENIFVSSLAKFDGCKAIRGGIPVVFPQFGQPNKEMPQHGFARTSSWSMESSHIQDTSASVTFSLTDCPATFSIWPHKFKLEYTVTLSSEQLTCNLQVKNIDATPFHVHTLLHTYLKVPSILGIRVTGFKDRSYVDKVRNSSVFVDTREVACIDCEVDRVMTGFAESMLSDTVLDIRADEIYPRLLTVTASAFLQNSNTKAIVTVPHDVVFWNPWIDKAVALVDLGDDDYKNFVCIEPGTTTDWVCIQPDDVLTLKQTLTLSASAVTDFF